MPQARGYSSLKDRPPPGLNLVYNPSAHSNTIFHGFMRAHRFPINATTKPIPTHQMTQTKVGEKFREGVWLPKSPVAMTKPNRKTDSSLIGASSNGLAMISRNHRRRNRLYRQ